ncbi:amino acid transporter, partial [Streptomyces sp. CHA15]|nr:amino acid transporter [Streptomyces sp. CHA15]
SLFDSLRHALLRGLCPRLGAIILSVIFWQTAIASLSPDFGSGSHLGGIGLVFIIAVTILALGLVLMLFARWRAPAFFQGETLAALPHRS